MDEAAVQLKMSTQMPERVLVMVVVEMGVASEHLLDDTFGIVMEVLVETRGFANPVVSANCQLVQGLCEAGGACCDGCTWSRRV